MEYGDRDSIFNKTLKEFYKRMEKNRITAG
jgi:hypothetical protein